MGKTFKNAKLSKQKKNSVFIELIKKVKILNIQDKLVDIKVNN